MKNVAVLTEAGHLPSFSVPTPEDLTAQESPLPGICHPRQSQKNADAWGSARGGGGGGGVLVAAGIDCALCQAGLNTVAKIW